MLSRIDLENLSFSDLRDLAKANAVKIPQHADQETIIQLMEQFYLDKQKELASEVEEQTEMDSVANAVMAAPLVKPSTVTGRKYAGYATKQEYIDAMLAPVLCIITPQASEFGRQSSSTAAISVGNSLIPNREFVFVADGATVVSVPRIAVNRIREQTVLVRGTTKLNKTNMRSNLEGSSFGKRFTLYELNEQEIAAYAEEKKANSAKAIAAMGVGL